MPTASATFRLRHLLLNAIVFQLCYSTANGFASRQAGHHNIAMAWEQHIPLLPWMVLPYMSSGLLLATSFWVVRRQQDVLALSQRLLLATVVASLAFMAWPLQFSTPRPMVESSLWSAFFDVLTAVDKPYNQFPSLHVAYCVILVAALKDWPGLRALRGLVLGWLVLVAVSTVFTYQHHVADVAGGVLLGWVCVRSVSAPVSAPRVALYYSLGAGVWLVIAAAWLPWWLGAYGALSLLLVARAYAKHDVNFLRKTQGSYPAVSWLLYAPYLLGYWLTWMLVRLRERKRPPVQQMGTRLWVGRRLSHAEVKQLPDDCTVIDLANELPETSALQKHRYYGFTMLDLTAPDAAVVRAILSTMEHELESGRNVFLHCAMGYARSRYIAQTYLSNLTQPHTSA